MRSPSHSGMREVPVSYNNVPDNNEHLNDHTYYYNCGHNHDDHTYNHNFIHDHTHHYNVDHDNAHHHNLYTPQPHTNYLYKHRN